jgi:hypothetical protein
MSDDMLERATRALSAKYSPENAALRGDLGLRRVEQSLADRRGQPSRWRLVTLVIAASFVALTAWASVSGHLPRWFRASAADTSRPPQRGDSASGDATHSPATTSTETRSEAPVPADPAPLVAPSLTGPKSRPRAPDMPPKAAPAPVPSLPDLDVLYREAHDAHFSRNDPSAALVAWDRYIAAAGANGRMMLEARYNRAMALVRLGRSDDAKQALEPFARGEFGGYRREEARRLLESLH